MVVVILHGDEHSRSVAMDILAYRNNNRKINKKEIIADFDLDKKLHKKVKTKYIEDSKNLHKIRNSCLLLRDIKDWKGTDLKRLTSFGRVSMIKNNILIIGTEDFYSVPQSFGRIVELICYPRKNEKSIDLLFYGGRNMEPWGYVKTLRIGSKKYHKIIGRDVDEVYKKRMKKELKYIKHIGKEPMRKFERVPKGVKKKGVKK